ncbi:MAG: spore coat associated protein CotJA [Clostridia bacterium]|nr:spore coat associated protein CotJA [Clostridia bacterium]
MQDNKFFSSNPMFGHAYVPIQVMKKIYFPEESLEKGTAFPELYNQYRPLESMEAIRFLKDYKERSCAYEPR